MVRRGCAGHGLSSTEWTLVPRDRIIVVGAGIGGLAAASRLAARGLDVLILERAAASGGKLRQTVIDGCAIDAGPTVCTMKWAFEELFAACGTTLDQHLTFTQSETLARHAWDETGHLDLFSNVEKSADAIGRLAGAANARSYRRFCAQAEEVYETLEQPFMCANRPSMLGLTAAIGLGRLGALWRIRPFATLWQELGRYFPDPRLRQLFGRYATYCGSSPFLAPATLMLVAHAERQGVWLIKGGMHGLAKALETIAIGHGATFRYGSEVAAITADGGRVSGVRLTSGETLAADAVVFNGDIAATSATRDGLTIGACATRSAKARRSLSAVTIAAVTETRGFPLHRHNVFFSADYPTEFREIAAGRLPSRPTVYVCAQDRDAHGALARAGPERLFCIVNAPARGDSHAQDPSETASCIDATFQTLRRCGLTASLHPDSTVITTPRDFARLFPATGGALYGMASHGATASFRRQGSKGLLPGLSFAGGSVHPGPGLPMAALSGRLAAANVISDLASMRTSSRAAMRGGTSMPSAMTRTTD
jgi:1-hydroxycarotenoid 3,4-desaturase